jgi:hypothetical protein
MGDNTSTTFHPMAPADFVALGKHSFAYIKREVNGGETVWVVRSADGSEIGRLAGLDIALGACLQHNWEVLSVH